MTTRTPALGAAAIALALAFNAPYAVLAATYDYPAVLRGSAGDALALYAAGGPALVLTWHAFALCALALTPLALALSLSPARLAAAPRLAVGAAVAGALAGVMQAVGLWRWVFVVPDLARAHAAGGADAEAAERAFALLNAYGGVAIGEHLGQLLTALFVAQLATLQVREGARITGLIGAVTAVAITLGTGEGLALALGSSGEVFSLATIAGFLGLTVWLIATGLGLILAPRTPSPALAHAAR